MAYLEMHSYSAALQRQVTVNVLLPESSKSSGSVGKPEGSCKTLYLYHGLSGDQTAWTPWPACWTKPFDFNEIRRIAYAC